MSADAHDELTIDISAFRTFIVGTCSQYPDADNILTLSVRTSSNQHADIYRQHTFYVVRTIGQHADMLRNNIVSIFSFELMI
jgi:hypothetical protein